MDAVAAYSFASCAWNALQAIPLLASPQAILALLVPNRTPYPQVYDAATVAAAQYLARSLGLALLALGLVTVVLTGSVPLGPALDQTPSPYAAPVLLLTTLHHGAAAFYSWARYASAGRTAHALGFGASACLAALGTWCLLFADGGGGGDKARVGRPGKRTSGFPFRNAEAQRRKARGE